MADYNLDNRIASRSRDLKERFPEVYREFFAKSDIVCSASHHFFWSGAFIALFGGPAILQKLPTKVLVGLQLVDEPTIRFGSFTTYRPLRGEFVKDRHDTYVIRRIVPWLREHYGKKNQGVVVHILSEMPTGVGLNASGALAAALSAALLLWHGKVTAKQIQEWESTKTMKKMLEPKTGFELIARLAWQIEAIFQSDSASGAGWAGAMVPSRFPLLYLAEYRIGDKSDFGHARFPLMTAGDLDVYQKLSFWIYRLEELYKPEMMTFPLDYCLVYSGCSNTVASVKASNKSLVNKLKNKTTFIKDILKDFKPNSKSHYADPNSAPKMPMLVDDIHFWGWEWLMEWEALGPLNMASFTILQLLGKIYRDEYDIKDVEEFISSINRDYSVMTWSSAMMPNMADVVPIINSYFRTQLPGSLRGVKPIEIGGGKGDMLICVPAGELRNREDKLINFLRKETGNENVTLDFANWLDGYGTEGLTVDQWTSEGIHSPFLTKGSLRVQMWDTDLRKTTKIISPRQLIKLADGNSLVIDYVSEAVIVGEKPITSKDLPTVKTTVEIMKRLLASDAKVLGNCEMPASSYATSRNDLQSKVVAPLMKLVKKRVGRELKLVVRGNMAEYQLILDGSQLPIYLIDKVF